MGPIKRPNPFKSQEKLGEIQTSEPSLMTAQGKNHPKTSASHEKNRLKVCVVCWIFTKIPLNNSLKTEIEKLPLGVCSNCKNGLYEVKNTGVNYRNLALHHRSFDHVLIPPPTRAGSKQICSCIICETAQNKTLGNFKKFCGATKKLHSIQVKKIQKPVPKVAPKN